VKSLEKVAGEAEGENRGWKTKLIIFVGGTCRSVHAQTLNKNLKELGVVESKRNTMQRSGERGGSWNRESTVEEAFQGLDSFIQQR
jgi:hypothetical protein